jgi:hypothetical protein
MRIPPKSIDPPPRLEYCIRNYYLYIPIIIFFPLARRTLLAYMTHDFGNSNVILFGSKWSLTRPSRRLILPMYAHRNILRILSQLAACAI